MIHEGDVAVAAAEAAELSAAAHAAALRWFWGVVDACVQHIRRHKPEIEGTRLRWDLWCTTFRGVPHPFTLVPHTPQWKAWRALGVIGKFETYASRAICAELRMTDGGGRPITPHARLRRPQEAIADEIA